MVKFKRPNAGHSRPALEAASINKIQMPNLLTFWWMQCHLLNYQAGGMFHAWVPVADLLLFFSCLVWGEGLQLHSLSLMTSSLRMILRRNSHLRPMCLSRSSSFIAIDSRHLKGTLKIFKNIVQPITQVKQIETLTFFPALWLHFLGCESDGNFCDCISGCTCRSWTLSGIRNYYGLMATLSMQPSWESNDLGSIPNRAIIFGDTQISWWKWPLSMF